MTKYQKYQLIEAAAALPEPTAEAATEYEQKSDAIVSELNAVMAARPDLDALIGPGNTAMMEDNHRNHARFMISLLATYSAEVLVNTVLWVFRAYRAHGFKLTYWPAQLDTWVDLLKKHLSPSSFAAIYPVYDFLLIHQPDFVALSDAVQEPCDGA
ncbi:MAG: hypothetical protein ACOCY8_01325 [Spirochaetota bacterium]